jgi:hypothetical protein
VSARSHVDEACGRLVDWDTIAHVIKQRLAA